MGEVNFDSFTSSPQFSVPERRQSSQDRHLRQAQQAILFFGNALSIMADGVHVFN